MKEISILETKRQFVGLAIVQEVVECFVEFAWKIDMEWISKKRWKMPIGGVHHVSS